jgi:hypothetical protein
VAHDVAARDHAAAVAGVTEGALPGAGAPDGIHRNDDIFIAKVG